MEVTGISLTPVQTMGQKLAKAGLEYSNFNEYCILCTDLISFISASSLLLLSAISERRQEAKSEPEKKRLLQLHLLQTLQMMMNW